MSGNVSALTTLIRELERNLTVCDTLISDARWNLVEEMASRRSRAAATLRAVLRWYGVTPPPRRQMIALGKKGSLSEFLRANSDLEHAYERIAANTDGSAPESRLIAEQLEALRRDRAELAQHVGPRRSADLAPPRADEMVRARSA